MESYVDVKEILSKLGYVFVEHGEELSMRPLYRDSDNPNALSVNKKTGKFYDFVTGKGGDFNKLIQLTSVHRQS